MDTERKIKRLRDTLFTMIIIALKAGLGNQMFQYACGRALSLRNKDILKLDINNWLKDKEHTRKYLLSHFNIVENIASDMEIGTTKFPYGIVSMVIHKIKIKLGMTNVSFYSDILHKKGNVYLDGYWQSERYFLDCVETIRNDFMPKQKLREPAAGILKSIENSEIPISLQVRRGDNAHSPASMRGFGTPSIEYYIQAVKTILDKVKEENKKAHIYVFSDEIDWAQECLRFDCQTTFVSCPNIAEWEELSLMKACHHHVISNSTFGWWGAWLNPRPNKIVVAPKRWALLNVHQFKDLIPDEWIRL
jgi:hypothetical protein